MSSVALDPAVNPDADGLVGSLTLWPCDTLPSSKYMFAEGQAVSRTLYSLLFARYGTLHGVGDGSTTFGLPDLVDVFVYGGDGSNTGDTGGSATGTVSGTTDSESAHTHGAGSLVVNAPATATIGAAVAGFNSSGNQSVTGTTGAGSSHDHSVSGTADTIPPYVRLRYIVKVL